MPQSGYCEVYVYVDDFSAISGDADHYAEFTLASIPQKDVTNIALFDMRVIVHAEDNLISLEIKHGVFVRVSIPTVGLQKSFVVPEEESLNLADLIDAEEVLGNIIINPSDHGLLTGLQDDDHTQYHNDTRGDVRYYTKPEVDALLATIKPYSAYEGVFLIIYGFVGDPTFTEEIQIRNEIGELMLSYDSGDGSFVISRSSPFNDQKTFVSITANDTKIVVYGALVDSGNIKIVLNDISPSLPIVYRFFLHIKEFV